MHFRTGPSGNYFDRSGVISSTDMNLETEAGQNMLYSVLGILGLATRGDLGYVERLCPSASWPSLENAGSLHLWDRNGDQQEWKLANLKELKHGSHGLIGRGTSVYSFGEEDDGPFALKLSWGPRCKEEPEFAPRYFLSR